ncbi:MAG TPA: hypothetical protein VGG97_04005 [Bryobacteraceae bacterium]|jgi:hypothetical protein
MKAKLTTMPVFKSESDEAEWWASSEGRGFVKRQAAAEPASQMEKSEGSPLVARLNKSAKPDGNKQLW